MGKKQEIYHGFDSYLHINEIILKNKIKKALLVCDPFFDSLFIKSYIESLPCECIRFSDFKPNPLYEDVVKGVRVFREQQCQFIISIGGGSAIDVAKCIKLFSVMDDDKLYLEQEFKDSKILHLAIPTTAGTGSESTRYAVAYYNGNKQSITHDSIIPDFVILEPEFLKTLPEYQKKATVLDALCQCIESFWSVNSTEESQKYSIEGIKLILSALTAYMAGERDALEKISIAANYSGRAINITQTTAAHAMSYKITSVYGIAHGHAVALCLPFVWKYISQHTADTIDIRGESYLAGVLDKLNELFFVDSCEEAVERFCGIIQALDMEVPVLKDDQNEIEVLVKSVNPVRLKNNPVPLTEAAIRSVYSEIFAEKKKTIIQS